MPAVSRWKVPASVQPRPEDYAFDLEAALSSMVGLRSTVPADAFTAETLGTERAGNGVLIRDGIVLTIGYLVTEADSVWLSFSDGRVLPGHVRGYDQETGFGLVQALGTVDLPVLPLGRSGAARVGDRVVVGAAGGRQRSVAARIAAKEEFAGYWEYVLDEAIFTSPAHPHWGGTALIGRSGDLLGVGSLQLEEAGDDGQSESLNMVVPIDLLPPILDDLLAFGRPNRPARPWLGVFATEQDDHIVIAGVATGGPADRAGLKTGDVVLAVNGEEVGDLADCFRSIWDLGEAGVEVPLRIGREGRPMQVLVPSGDRNRFLKGPSLH